MCGIAGEVSWAGRSHASADELLATVRHRGPDSSGSFAHDIAWVGQTRLAIIDVPGGDPPICNEDGTVGVALNGEIYNFRELRSELRERGHVFSTGCDTEAIVHLAEELDPVALAARVWRACSRSPCGTRRVDVSSWRVIGSARSRCTTGTTPTGSCLGARSRRCSPIRWSRGGCAKRRSPTT